MDRDAHLRLTRDTLQAYGQLRRHDLGVSHNDFGDSGRARGIREAAAKHGSFSPPDRG
jgi:hypothetical protein